MTAGNAPDPIPSAVDAASGDPWRFFLSEAGDPTRLAREWRAAESRDTPFFLSWDWIGCWLKSVTGADRPRVLRVEHGGVTVGTALVTPVPRRRLGLLPYRAIYLHETGGALDSLYIEYNGLLAAPSAAADATRRAVDWLLATHADEIHLSGVPADLATAINASHLAVLERDRKPIYAVDLARIAANGTSFATTLSANARAQLRRAVRQFESLGPTRIVAARTRDDALAMLDAMIPLHQAHWRGHGRPGAFADPGFVAFHRRLIEDSFANGCIQFLRCEAGASVIGYLYNFRKDGHVYCYQSGFDYGLLPRCKPGWVCHALAIEDNLRAGAQLYDLLAGESQFKASIATRGETLVWLTVRRNDATAAIMGLLRALKQRARAWREALARERRP